MTVGLARVWAARGVHEHLPSQLKQILAGDVCDMGYGVVMEADAAMALELV